MKLYHTTTLAAAHEIDVNGFESLLGAGGTYFADRPLGRADLGPMAAVIFAITLSSEELDGVDTFDVNHGDIAYREWLVPDKIANRVSRGRLSIDSRIAAFEPDQPVVDGEEPT